MKNLIIKTCFDYNKISNKFNKIFLGNHCNKYDYKNKKIVDLCNISSHHWNNYQSFIDDYNYINSIYIRTLNHLTLALNEFHQLNKSKLFWEILVGPWLIYYCVNIFDRWKLVTSIKYKKNLFTILNNSLNKSITPYTIEDYKRVINSEIYNHYIFSKILLFKKDLKVTFINSQKDIYDDLDLLLAKKKRIKDTINFFLKKIYIILFGFFIKKQKIAVLRSYLGVFRDLKINFSLLQFPCVYLNESKNYNLNFKKNRKNLNIKFKAKNEFEKFLLNEIIYHIPKVFVEKFDNMQSTITESSLPKNPKIVYATNFSSSTFLSFYCANKKEDGSKLFLGQHGGCYGQYDRHWSEDFEISISDRFFTYGWISKRFVNKTIPLGIQKDIKVKKRYDFNKQSKLLLIIRSRSKFINKLDSSINSNQKFDYIRNCYDFVNNLNSKIKKKTLIRLRDIDLGWAEHPRFKKKFPSLSFENGTSKIFELMNSSKIVVSTALSTSYLESLAMNIPSIVISNYKSEPMRPEAIKYLNLLIEAKIFHLTPQSAAEHINKYWDNIEEWWFSNKVQNNRKTFCNKYSCLNENFDKKLLKYLKSSVN